MESNPRTNIANRVAFCLGNIGEINMIYGIELEKMVVGMGADFCNLVLCILKTFGRGEHICPHPSGEG